MRGDSTVKLNLILSPADIVRLKYAPVTADVEGSFSQYNLSSETIEKIRFPVFERNVYIP